MEKSIRIKNWLLEQVQQKAKHYDVYIDEERTEQGALKLTDGFATVVGEILSETEKAVKVLLSSGKIVGSYKGWETWLPKSCVIVLEH